MKIRTDFVTNSSSSSFVTVNISSKNGETFELDFGQDSYVNEEAIPFLKGNTLVYSVDNTPSTISTVSELLACIYFSQSDGALPFEVCTAIFDFLMNQLSPKKLINKLKKYDGFEQLEDFDPDEYDEYNEAELCVELMEFLTECLEEFDCGVDFSDEAEIETYSDILESLGELKDIEKIKFQMGESNWDEFMESYSVRLADCLSNRTFAAVPASDPSYKTQYEFWLDVLKYEVFYGCEPLDESFESLVKKALASGDPFDMIPSSVLESRDIATIVIPEGIGSVFQCDEVSEIAFEGKIFVLTGHSEKQEAEIKAIIEARGGEVKSSTVLKTDYLIINEDYEKPATIKYKKALELKEKGKNIQILDAKRFFELSEVKKKEKGKNIQFFDAERYRKLRSVKKIKKSSENPFVIKKGVLEEYRGNDSHVVIPDGITKIGEYAFQGCQSLVTIVIPHGITELGNYAFDDCPSLASITIPEGVKRIGWMTFASCRSLESITIPESTKKISHTAFWGSRATIHTLAGSYAEQYAKENNIPFVAE